MDARQIAVVITTIQAPTECMRITAERVRRHGMRLIVIGDKIGPSQYLLPEADFFSFDRQRSLSFKLTAMLPEGSYARKNLGYLMAMSCGCDPIYETDDDNHPTDAWDVREQTIEAATLKPLTDAKWANIYSLFTEGIVWPRGFALEHVSRSLADDFILTGESSMLRAPIQQGLANGSPDVDAIWRLVMDREVTFNVRPNVVLAEHVWCPFNAQNTWWWRDAFPLMYLPATCTFRMTDIYRSFVCHKCLWAMGLRLEFHQADVKQLRNQHNLMHDFELELQGYRRNGELVELLESSEGVTANRSLNENIRTCYELLVRHKFLEMRELAMLDAWLEDCESLRGVAS